MGKSTLKPESQQAEVDALWKHHFPDWEGSCPLFSHYSDPHKNTLGSNVMPLSEVHPERTTASRVIFAGEKYDGSGLGPKHMLERVWWNGENFQEAAWDGTFGAALAHYEKELAHYIPEAQAKYTPQPDWLVVTVDYHS